MKPRRMGSVYRPTYKDKRTGELRQARTWSLRYYVRGRMLQEQSHSVKKTVAEKMLKDRIAAIAQGRRVGPDVEKTTVRNLLDMVTTDYIVNERKSLDSVQRAVRHLIDYFTEDARAVDLTEDRIASYVRHRIEEDHVENATINRELSALKRGFRLGERAGKVGRRPHVAMLRESNARQGFLERDALDRVLSHLPEDVKPVAEVAYLTGWRVRSEIITRTWAHVDFDSGWLRLEPGEAKNGEGRMFPMTADLRKVLEDQRERTTAIEKATGQIIPFVFHRDGRQIRSFRRSWISACTDAGVPGLVPHDFRRSAVRNLERAGVPRSAAMKMVGHKTESIYRRYAIVDEAMMREGAEKLAALHLADRLAISARTDSTPRIVSIGKGSPTAKRTSNRQVGAKSGGGA